MERKRQTWDVFLAHASADKKAAEELYDLLEPHCKIFLDIRCLLPGDDWDQKITLAQSHSLVTLVLISSHTGKAYYEREEIAAAISMARKNRDKHRVVPIFLDNKFLIKKMPYGLRLKNALSISDSDTGGFDEVANCIKELLKNIKDKKSISKKASKVSARNSLKGKLHLIEAITTLSEDYVLNELAVPLIEKLHPGKIEYALSSNNSCKNIISYGMDYLKRSHILCIQVRIINTINDHTFDILANTAESVKNIGVIRENGSKCFPDEIWFIIPHPFPERNREQMARMLQNLNRNHVKIITTEELCSLLIDHLSEIVGRILKYSTPEIVNLISSISKHNEGRAFGFTTDRNIDEFYVTAALFPMATRTYAAIREEISLTDHKKMTAIPVRRLLDTNDINKEDDYIRQCVTEKAIEVANKGVWKKYNLDIDVRFNDDIDIIKEKYIAPSLFQRDDFPNIRSFLRKLCDSSDPLTVYVRSKISPDIFKWLYSIRDDNSLNSNILRKLISELNNLLEDRLLYDAGRFEGVSLSVETSGMLSRNRTGNDVIISNRLIFEDFYKGEIIKSEYKKSESLSINVTYGLKNIFQKFVKDAKNSVRKCPSILGENVSKIKNAWKKIEMIENFIKDVSEEFRIVFPEYLYNSEEYIKNQVRVSIPQPENLLKIDNIILIEGPPGCGKTTLMKILAINVLSTTGKCLYLPCCNITPDFKNASLELIIQKFSYGSVSQEGIYKDYVLIIDGLDEASFDISEHILSSHTKFSNIVASVRTAFRTNVRSKAFRVALSPFINKERDQFFENWLRNDPELLDQSRELIRKYPDIEMHTRVPLIATIMVGLLQNKFVPKTRAEIYGYRLDLLLSRWDRLRGIKRLYVDNPDAKRRFLRQLAFQIHSSNSRRRNIGGDELKDIYEKSLGEWGYRHEYEKVLADLVVGSGVLIEERTDTYSFGHLTFQEHLAGEHIASTHSISQIASLMRSNWWREPLNFYASIKGDITDLIDHMMNDLAFFAHGKQLSEMIAYAPYTSAGATQCLNDILGAVRFSEAIEEAYDDED